MLSLVLFIFILAFLPVIYVLKLIYSEKNTLIKRLIDLIAFWNLYQEMLLFLHYLLQSFCPLCPRCKVLSSISRLTTIFFKNDQCCKLFFKVMFHLSFKENSCFSYVLLFLVLLVNLVCYVLLFVHWQLLNCWY